MISLKNLFSAWHEFSGGKENKKDVQEFEFDLEDNIFILHELLKNKKYEHHEYVAFNVCDPKLRRIHKATVRDRVLHHAIFRVLYPIFDKNFIFDSYSCRNEKGTHRAVNRLKEFLQKASKNNRKKVYALKCDVRKFFDSIDQEILLKIIKRRICGNGVRLRFGVELREDSVADTVWLLEKIIKSFPKGLPLGNVTSQLFANIYLNKLDQFVKHVLKEKYYLRYCDDFVVLSEDREHLEKLMPRFDEFLKNELSLNLHPNKIIIRKYGQGIDFLGYVVFPNHRLLRKKTKKRILRKISEKHDELKADLISEKKFNQILQSYLGMLNHCNGFGIRKEIEEILQES